MSSLFLCPLALSPLFCFSESPFSVSVPPTFIISLGLSPFCLSMSRLQPVSPNISASLLLCLLLSFSHSFSLSLSLFLFPPISVLLSLFASPSTPISLHFFSFSPGYHGKQEQTMEPVSPAQHFFSSPCTSLSPVGLPACPVLPA